MNVSGTTISATGHKGGLGDGLYDKAGARPDLDLDFARTKSLKDRVSKEELITFTRSSTGTYVDNAGLIKETPINYVTNHKLLHASYGTTSTDSIANPEGVVEDITYFSDVSNHRNLGGGAGPGENILYAGSVYMKTDQGTASPTLDVNDKNVTQVTVTDQWQRFSVVQTQYGSTAYQQTFRFLDITSHDSSTAFGATFGAGGSSKIYVWGLQLEKYQVTDLIKTTGSINSLPRFTHDPVTKESKGLLIEKEVINLLPYSEDFTQSDWMTTNASITGNQITAPDGTNTADLITATVGTTGNHRVRDPGHSLGPHQYTFSVFVKANTTNSVALQMFKSGATDDSILFRRYNLGDETVHGSTGDAKITKYPNGWYRLEGTSIPDSNTANTSVVIILYQNNDNTISYTGAGESMYVWGAQLEQSTSSTSYIPTSGGTVTRSPDLASIQGDNFGTYRKNLAQNTSFKPDDTDEFDNWRFEGNNQIKGARLEHFAALAPNGKYEAARLVAKPLASNNYHRAFTDIASSELVDGEVVTASCYLKADTISIVDLNFWDGSTPTVAQGRFTLTGNGTAQVIQSRGSNAQIEPVGNGWYRCNITSNALSKGTYPSVNITLLQATDLAALYLGTNEAIYVWGVQVENGSTLTEFIPSTEKFTNRQSNATFVDGNGIIRTSHNNIISYSEDFTTNGGFTAANVNIVPNTTTAPDGTQTASKWVMDSNSSARRRIQDGIGTNLINQVHTGSIYAKAGELSIVTVRIGRSITGTEAAKFNLSTGTIVQNGSLITSSSITPVGNGWYRLTVTNNLSNNLQQYFVISEDDSDQAYKAGDGSSGFFIWGAQVVKGSEAGDYYKTTGTISGPPRYSHDPDTLTPTGLYLEPEIDNKATTTETFTDSNYLYTDATDHTNTGNTLVNLATDNSITNPDGTTGTVFMTAVQGDLARLRVKGIRKAGIAYQTQTLSCFVKKKTNRYVSLSHGGVAQYRGLVFDFNTETITEHITGANFSFYRTGFVKYPNGWYRLFLQTEGATGGDGFAVHMPKDPTTSKPQNSGTLAYDGTESVYIWGLNCCNVGFLSNYIPNTTTSEITQNADIFTSEATEVLDRANGTKPAFYKKGNKVDNSGISIYSEAKYNASSHTNIANYSRILQLKRDNDLVLGIYKHNNQIQVIGSNPTEAPLFTQRGFNLGSGDLKIGVRNAEDDSRVYLNFNQSLSSRQGSLDVDVHTEKPTDLYIGNNGSSGAFTNGTIKRITFWKTPLPDNRLDKLTS